MDRRKLTLIAVVVLAVAVVFIRVLPLTVYPPVTCQLTLKVEDQCGNPLPAAVSVEGKTFLCNRAGLSPPVEVQVGNVSVYAEVKVGALTFNVTETVDVTCDMTETLVIYRRFLWKFNVSYVDGTLAQGNLTASSTVETLTVPVIDGYAELYLLNATYTFSFKENSAAVAFKTVQVKTDGEIILVLSSPAKVEQQVTSEISPSSPNSPVAAPVWVRVPFEYYLLLGFAMFVVLLTAIVSLRRGK